MLRIREDSGEEYLRIRYTDGSKYYTDELDDRYAEGEGACGTAWKSREQKVYAKGKKDKKVRFEPMGEKSPMAMRLKSVVSTPVFLKDVVVAVLNLDSQRPPHETHVETEEVQTVLRAAAYSIAPFLAVDLGAST
jgi:hypothetical protein